MQGGQGAISSVMEAAANVAASAKSGLDKTKAVIEEKKERMLTSDEVEKDMATLRKEEKIDLAELRKCKAYAQNAVAAALPASPANPGFTDGGEFDTIGSFTQQPAAVTAPDNAVVKTHCFVPSDSFVVEDVVGTPCPVVRYATGKVVSAENVSGVGSTGFANVGGNEGKVVSAENVSGIGSTGNANIGGSKVVDANPTHTGMPAPVVEPDGVGSGFRTETNTGSGTHFNMN